MIWIIVWIAAAIILPIITLTIEWFVDDGITVAGSALAFLSFLFPPLGLLVLLGTLLRVIEEGGNEFLIERKRSR